MKMPIKGGKFDYAVRLPLTRGEAKTLRDLLDAELEMCLDEVKDPGHDMKERLEHIGKVGYIHRKLHKTGWWKKK